MEVVISWVLVVSLLALISWLFLAKGRAKKLIKNTHWEDLNVPVCDTSKLEAGWNLLRKEEGVHVAEGKIYNKIRKDGFKSYVGLYEHNIPLIYVIDPELIKHVLIKDFDSFVDRRTGDVGKSDRLLSLILNNHKGQAWKDLRSTLSPAFTTGKLRRMYPLFTDSSEKMLNYIQNQAKTTQDLEFVDIMTRFTMDVIASAAFGLDPDSFAAEDSQFTKCALTFQDRYASKWSQLKLVLSMYFPKVFRFFRIPLTNHNNIGIFVDIVRQTIAYRAKSGERREDLLQILMDRRDPSAVSAQQKTAEDFQSFDKDAEIKSPVKKVVLTEELVLAQSAMFFFGGFSGLEVLMRMCCYELSLNQDIQEKLYQEIKTAADKNNGTLNYDIVMNAEYLDKVINESLRKWPSSTRLERMSTKAYTFPDPERTIPKDTLTLIPVYAMHHDERYYPNPDIFDPERFSPENKAKRPTYTFIPFGAGPRICLAFRYATAEAKVGMAQLLLKYKLLPSRKTKLPLKFRTNMAFKPQNGIFIRVVPRE